LELENFQCKKCGWTGNSDEVNWDTVETCMGDDKIEICPVCGSMEVYIVNTANFSDPQQ